MGITCDNCGDDLDDYPEHDGEILCDTCFNERMEEEQEEEESSHTGGEQYRAPSEVHYHIHVQSSPSPPPALKERSWAERYVDQFDVTKWDSPQPPRPGRKKSWAESYVDQFDVTKW